MDNYSLEKSSSFSEGHITVRVDGEVAGDVTKTLSRENITNGERFTLTLTDFDQGRKGNLFREWSGDVTLDIAANVIKDKAHTTQNGNEEVLGMAGTYIDNINPEFTYEYSNDVQHGATDEDEDKLVVGFTIADKYFKESTLTTKNIKVNIDQGKGTFQENIPVTLNLEKVEDVKVDGEKVGEKYVLTITDFEKATGTNYKDFSGYVTLIFSETYTKEDGTVVTEPFVLDDSNNHLTSQALTIGVGLPDGEGEEVLVDFVNPVWEKVESTSEFVTTESGITTKATLKVKGTDKYLKVDSEDATSILTPEDLEIYVDGSLVTEGIAVNVAENSKDSTSIEYTVTIEGFNSSANQVKVKFKAGQSLSDSTGNKNREFNFLAFNTLLSTDGEREATSKFLNIDGITRQEITDVTFIVDKAAEKLASDVDVSAKGDNSIWARVDGTKVTIYSKDEINLNSTASYFLANMDIAPIEEFNNLNILRTNNVTDMSYMFSNFGNTKCSDSYTISIDTRNVTNMQGMFSNMGQNSIKDLTLAGNFNTSNVTNMQEMFSYCGTEKLETINLGNNFNTGKVTTMALMFSNCGTKNLTKLELGDNFDTRNVTDMSFMFEYVGYQSNQFSGIDFGTGFDTSNVTNMLKMFYYLGEKSMTTLNLGNYFNTSNVEGMQEMFAYCGNKKLEKLYLGEYFYTNKVTSMSAMFAGCGENSMTSLDLGPAFTNIPEYTLDFVTNCGKTVEGDLSQSAVIHCAQLIYNDDHNFKLNKDVERVTSVPEGSTDYINYSRGTINAKYSPFWAKEDSDTAVTVYDDSMDINIVGTNQYNAYEFGKELSALTVNDIFVFVDGVPVQTITQEDLTTLQGQIETGNLTAEEIAEIEDRIANSIVINLGPGSEGIVKALRDGSSVEGKGIKYTVTLSNFEQNRKGGVKFKEWSGNVELRIKEGTLSDIYTNKNFLNTINDPEVDAETENTMFIDKIKPEITYISSETMIEQVAEENDNTPGVKQTVRLKFYIEDKYFKDSSLATGDVVESLISIRVGDKLIDVDDTVTKEIISVSDATETINGSEVPFGKVYVLEIYDLEKLEIKENENYAGYSGPITLTFAKDIAIDNTGNKSDGASITFGVDYPDGAGEGKVVDFVNPLWVKTGSEIKRARNGEGTDRVEVTVQGSDKYLDFENSNLEPENIKVYIDNVDSTSELDIEVEQQDIPDDEIVGGQKVNEYTEEFKITISGFGEKFSDYGKVFITIDGGTLVDEAGSQGIAEQHNNISEETTFWVGNNSWIEKVPDETDNSILIDSPQYTAFKETDESGNGKSIVDFQKPVIKYVYGENTNPIIDREAQTLTVVFDVWEKYIYDDGLTLKADGTTYSKEEIEDNLRIQVWGINNDVIDISERIYDSANTKLEIVTQYFDNGDNGIGRRYKLTIHGFEKALESEELYRHYSGPVQLVFVKDTIADTSGNKNDETTIIIDRGNGDGINDSNDKEYINIDVVKPVWEDSNVGDALNLGEDIEFTRNRDDASKVDSVTLTFRGTDKYLDVAKYQDEATRQNALDTFESRIKLYTVNDEGNKVENTTLSKELNVKEIKTEDRDLINGTSENDSTYEIVYTLTLTGEDFKEYSGEIYVVIPKDEIKDTSGLNAAQDKEYLIPRVDFITPKWSKTTINEPTEIYSNVSRTRNGDSTDQVQIKLTAFDKYIDKRAGNFSGRMLEEKDIDIYFYTDDSDEDTRYAVEDSVRKDLITNIELLPGTDTTVEYIITLSNFNDYSGKVDIGINTREVVKDTQENKNELLNPVGVGNAAWQESIPEKTIDEDTGEEVITLNKVSTETYPAFSQDIVDFINPRIQYTDSEIVYDNAGDNDKFIVEFDAFDKYLFDGSLDVSNMSIYIEDQGNQVCAYGKEAVTEDGVLQVELQEGTQNGDTTHYVLTVTNFDVGKILETEQYTRYSGPITLVFEEGLISDTSGNMNTKTTITVKQDSEEDKDLIVDVVDPVWNFENLVIDRDLGTVTVDLCGTDKYYNIASKDLLDESDIEVWIDRERADTVENNTNVIKTITNVEDIKLDGTNTVIGVRKTLVISNFEEATRREGRKFLEWSGNIKLKIAAGTIEDYTENEIEVSEGVVETVSNVNKNVLTTLELIPIPHKTIEDKTVDVVDFIKPEIVKTKVTTNATETTAPTKMTYVFEVTDKYFDYTPFSKGQELTDNSLIEVFVNEESAVGVKKKIVDVKPIEYNGKKVGEEYTLELTEFEQERFTRKYTEWSGEVYIDIQEGIFIDTSGNSNDKVNKEEGLYIDSIEPEFTYKFSEFNTETREMGDIDYTAKTLTVRFDITDKYFADSKLAEYITNNDVTESDLDADGWAVLDNSLIEIKVDGDISADALVTKRIRKVQDYTFDVDAEQDGEEKVGEQFELVISGLEQIKVQDGDNYKDYSGPVHVILKEKIAKDQGYDFTNVEGITSRIPNESIEKTITIGIGVPDGEGEEQIVDVVDPIWTKIESEAEFNVGEEPIAKITLQATDKYYDDVNSVISTLTSEEVTQETLRQWIKVYQDDNNDISEDVIIDVNKTDDLIDTDGRKYGEEYEFIVKGFSSSMSQLSISLNQGIIQDIEREAKLDADGNKIEDGHFNVNLTTEKFIMFNTLVRAETPLGLDENSVDSNFLGTGIERKSVTKIIFERGIPEEAFNGSTLSDGYYDVSQLKDKSIIAYLNGTELHVVSNDEIHANIDSSYLFAHLGYEATSFTIEGLANLNTKHVTDMTGMFLGCGYTGMTGLNLGTNFYTKNVTEMDSMFENCGFEKMETISLGGNFNTDKVTSMASMFKNTGHDKLISLSLGDKFNTSNVTTMASMFEGCGNLAMITLTLDTTTAKTNFDTSKVTNMNSMFKNCGNTALTSLSLGYSFTTNAVTDMNNMFEGLGTTAMTSLDLGPAFVKIDSNSEIDTVGKENATTIYVGEAIYNNSNNFKYTANTERVDEENPSGDYINYTRGTINPKYAMLWRKTAVSVAENKIDITIKGSDTDAGYVGYSQDSKNRLKALMNDNDWANGIKLRIDDDEIDTLTEFEKNSIQGDSNLTEEAKTEIIANSVLIKLSEPTETTDGVTYIVTLENVEQAGRKLKKDSLTEYRNYTEWSGNIALTIPENTLVDQFGNQNFFGNPNFDDEVKDEVVNKETAQTMFKDNIKPEFTYEYNVNDIKYGLGTVTINFSITDKYFAGGLTAEEVGVHIDGQLVTTDGEEVELTKTLNETVITETINGRNQTVGYNYTVVISGFDQGKIKDGDKYVNYSGPLSLVFAEGVITDTSGNKSPAKTITVGVDEPIPPTTGDTLDSEIIDFVIPRWTFVDSRINRSRNSTAEKPVVDEVFVTIKGTDKYLEQDTLDVFGTDTPDDTTDDLRVRIDNQVVAVNSDKVKLELVERKPITETRTEFKIVDGVDATTEVVNVTVGYEYTFRLFDFGSEYADYGNVDLVFPANTLKDKYGNYDSENDVYNGNYNIETVIGVGKPGWKDDGVYTAFADNIVDFEKPNVTWGSYTVDQTSGEVILRFSIHEKYIKDTLKTGLNVNNSDKMLIIIDDAEVELKADGLNGNLTSVSNGYEEEYTLTLSNFDSINVNNKYGGYSGPISLCFKPDVITDTSGNKFEGHTFSVQVGEEDVTVDVVKPSFRKLEDNEILEGRAYFSDADKASGLNTRPFRSEIYRERNNTGEGDTVNTDKVVVYVQGTDKYFDVDDTVGDSLNDDVTALQNGIIVNVDGTQDSTAIVEVEKLTEYTLKEESEPHGVYGFIYKITVSNFTDKDGELQLVLPAGVLYDTSDNVNVSKTIDVKNTTWVEIGDDEVKYTGFRQGIVDYVKPVWTKETSSIDRTNNTVTLEIHGTDDYYLSDTLAEVTTEEITDAEGNVIETKTDLKNVVVYVEDPDNPGEWIEEPRIQKSIIVKPEEVPEEVPDDGTEDGEEEPTEPEEPEVPAEPEEEFKGIKYLLTLSNIKEIDYVGKMMIKIKAGSIADSSGNLNDETDYIPVGNPYWIEEGDSITNPKYTAFATNLVDFRLPKVTFNHDATFVDWTNEYVRFEFDVKDENFYYDSSLFDADGNYKDLDLYGDGNAMENLNTVVDGLNANTINEDIQSATLIRDENDTPIGMKFVYELHGFEKIGQLSGINVAVFSGKIDITVRKDFIKDTSGNGNAAETVRLVKETKDGEGNVIATEDIISDFVHPYIYIDTIDTGINVNTKTAKIVVNATDRFYYNPATDSQPLNTDASFAVMRNENRINLEDITINLTAEGKNLKDEYPGLNWTEEYIWDKDVGVVRDASGNVLEGKTEADANVIPMYHDPNADIVGDEIFLGYKYRFVIPNYVSDEYFDVAVAEKLIVDQYGNWNRGFADDGIIDLKKPDWEYVEAQNESLDTEGTVSFKFRAKDMDILRTTIHSNVNPDTGEVVETEIIDYNGVDLSTDYFTIYKDGKKVENIQIFEMVPGVDAEGNEIEVVPTIASGKLGVCIRESEHSDVKPDPKETAFDTIDYDIILAGLEPDSIGTYTFVFKEGSIKDFSGNINNGTSFTFDKSVICSDSETTVRYYTLDYYVKDKIGEDYVYVSELNTVDELKGTNSGSTTYIPSTLYDLYQVYENNPDIKGSLETTFATQQCIYNEATGTFDTKVLSKWAAADYSTGKLLDVNGVPMETEGQILQTYDPYEEIPDTVTALRPVWEDGNVIFVKNDGGSDSNDGLSTATPVQTITGAYSKMDDGVDASKQVIVVMDEVSLEGTLPDKNVTLTSFYAGVDYRATNGAKINVTNNVSMTADLVIENIRIDSSSNTVLGAVGDITGSYSNLLIANYNKLTIRRGVDSSSGKYTFGAIIGGNYGSTLNVPTVAEGETFINNLTVESGKYNNIFVGSCLTNSQTITTKIENHVNIGSRKDAAKGLNTELTITGYMSLGENEVITRDLYDEDIFADINIYTGTFTSENGFNAGGNNTDAAIYLRKSNEQVLANVQLDMIGGEVQGNIYSGEDAGNADSTLVLTDMNFNGGYVLGNIFGLGTQSYDGDSSIDISGIFEMKGNIYGGIHSFGNVTDNIVKHIGNTNISINSESVIIEGDVLAGHLGDVKTIDDSNVEQEITNVTFDKGKIVGNMYGGSEGNKFALGTANVTISGGQIIEDASKDSGTTGTIFGGSKLPSSVVSDSDIESYNNANYGLVNTANINLSAGLVSTVFGSGNKVKVHTVKITSPEGDTLGLSPSSVDVEGNDGYNDPITTIYGGSNSKYAKVYTASIEINSGAIKEIYGAGLNTNNGDGTSNIKINGTTDNSNGQIIKAVYGGSRVIYPSGITLSEMAEITENAKNDAVMTTSNIEINGKRVTNVYGGGRNSKVTTVNITMNGGIVEGSVYGSSYIDFFTNFDTNGDEKKSENKNRFSNSITETSNIKLTAGSIWGNVFGGGYRSKTDNPNIYLGTLNGLTNSRSGSAYVGTLYGGFDAVNESFNAYINVNENAVETYTEEPNIRLYSGSVPNLYVGGNYSGVKNSDLVIFGGSSSKAIHGGAAYAPVVEGGHVSINVLQTSGTYASIYGGSKIGLAKSGSDFVMKDSNDILKDIPIDINIGVDAIDKEKALAIINEGVVEGDKVNEIPSSYYNDINNQKGNVKVTNIYGGSETDNNKYIDYQEAVIVKTNTDENNKTSININIDGNGYDQTKFEVEGIIQGEGRGTSYSKTIDESDPDNKRYPMTSNINIKNFGKEEHIQNTLAIQRADNVIIDNSYIELYGITDSNTSYELKDDNYKGFALNRIEKLNIQNGTNLFFEKGINIIKEYNSRKNNPDFNEELPESDDNKRYIPETVTITGNQVTEGGQNRIFVLDSVSLYFAKVLEPNDTTPREDWTPINGMTYFGQFAFDRASVGTVKYDIYHPNFEVEGDATENFFKNPSSVYAQENEAADYVGADSEEEDKDADKTNGFYTQVGHYELNAAGNGYNITVTREYMTSKDFARDAADQWNTQVTEVEEVEKDETDKYVLMAKAIQPDEYTTEDIVINLNDPTILGTSISGAKVKISATINSLRPGIILTDPETIPVVNKDATSGTNYANTTFGLEYEAISGWINGYADDLDYSIAGESKNLSGYIAADAYDNTAYVWGDNTLITDGSNQNPVIRFKLHSSNNISNTDTIGSVNIVLDVYNSEGEFKNTKIIVLELAKEIEDSAESYGYASEFTNENDENIASTLTFTKDSRISLTYSFYRSINTTIYSTNTSAMDSRVLISKTGAIPVGTKITMTEYTGEWGVRDKNYRETYYYQVNDANVSEIPFSNFKFMKTSKDVQKTGVAADDAAIANYFYSNNKNSVYYSSTYKKAAERFEFIFDFSDANMTEDFTGNFQMQLRNAGGGVVVDQTSYKIFKVTIDNSKYTRMMFNGIKTTAEVDPQPLTLPTLIDEINTDFTISGLLQKQSNVIDTKYYERYQGMAVEMVDSLGKRIKLSDDDYIANSSGDILSETINGVIRLKLTDTSLANMNYAFKLHLAKKNIATGNYKIVFYFFASEDGKFFNYSYVKDGISEGFGTFVFKQEVAVEVITANTGFDVRIPVSERIVRAKEDKGFNIGYTEGTRDSSLEFKLITNELNIDNIDPANNKYFITATLYKRNATYEGNVYKDVSYTKVDFDEYFENSVTEFKTKEYKITKTNTEFNGEKIIDFKADLEDNISTENRGEYKIVFNLYSENNVLLQTAEKTFMIVD